MKARLFNLDINYETDEGKATFVVDKKQLAILEKFYNKDLEITIKEYKEPRTNNANSYMWVILQQMADITGTSKEELYKKYIREKGLFRIITVDNKGVQTLQKIWEDRGLGWFSEIVNTSETETEIMLYYGTSSYNTKQMSLFTDYIVQDAKDLGIDTSTYEEQQLLNSL